MSQMGLIRNTITACLLLILSLVASAVALAEDQPDPSADDARLEAIKAHLASIIVPDVRLEFEKAGPRLPYEGLPGGQALVYAAYYYAVSTGDFAVSYADLLENGYWPYDIYDAQYSGDFLYGFDEEPSLYPYRAFEEAILGYKGDQLDAELMADTSTPEWIFHTRAVILEQFYNGCFDYYADDPFAAVERLKPCAPFWDVDGLEDADGMPARRIEEVAVSRYVNRNYIVYRDAGSGMAPPADLLDSLMVQSFEGDMWQQHTKISPNSGYDSQYREATCRVRDEEKTYVTPGPGSTPAG